MIRNSTLVSCGLHRFLYRFGRLARILALLLLVPQAFAGPLPGLWRGDTLRKGLASVLAADGSIRAGSAGSFDPEGFRMETGPDGRPVFRPAGSAGAGDAQWRTVGNGTNATVFAVAVAGSDVYVGGIFTLAGGVPARGVAKWNGSAWSALGAGLGSATIPGFAYALAIAPTGEVYVGGDFSEINGTPIRGIAKWNGSAWSALGSGVSGTVRALALAANGDLYVGGAFTGAGGISSPSVVKWNGSAWSALGQGLSGGTSIGGTVVRALAIAPNGDVFAGGDFTEATSGPGLNYLARWDGAVWNPLGSGMNGPVRGLALSGDDLYACGDFTTAGGATTGRLARWDGAAWNTVGGVYSATLITNCVAVASNGDLFVGGGTIYLGNATYTPGIAKWNGVSWSTLGTGLNDLVRTIVVSPNRQVNVGGGFTAVGDNSKPIPCFGIYDDSQATIATIISFTPVSGPAGTIITINGTNLTGTSSIRFAGPGNPTVTGGFTVNAAGTQITGVVVPAGTQTGLIRATTPIGVATSPANFTVPAPVLTSISPASGMVGTSVTLTGTLLAGATQVSFNGTTTSTFTSNSATQVVLAVPGGATTGPVTVTTPAGTSNALAFTVTCPVATIAYGASSYCQTASVAPAPTLTGPTGGSFTAAAGLALNATTGVITPASSTPGTYTISYAGGTAGCPTTAAAQVTITAAPSAAFAYPAAAYCAGSGNLVAPVLGANAAVGTFSALPVGLALNATTGSIDPAGSAPGTYTVTNAIGAANGCAATSATAAVRINPLPTATLTASGPTTFCQGGAVVLTAPAGAGNTYQFLRNNAAISGATTAAYSATTSGDYRVIVTSAGCSALSAVVTVAVNPATSAAFAYSGSTHCVGGANPTPTVTGTAGGTFSAPTGLGLNAATGTINLATSTPGTYAVTYSVGGACPSSATTAITITAAPIATFIYPVALYCEGGFATATPTLSPGATAGTFSAPAGLTINASTGVVTAATSLPGTYTVTNTVAAAGGCAAVAATSGLTIAARPATPVLTAAYNGATTTLTSSAATGNQFYFNNGLIAGATGQAYVVNGAPAALGSYTVTTTNANGCVSLPSAPLVVTSSLKPLAGSSIAIYPNPTQDGRLTVALTGYRQATELTVLNALGQVVFLAYVPGATGKTAQPIDLARLAAGVYILRVKTEESLDTRRIVRE